MATVSGTSMAYLGYPNAIQYNQTPTYTTQTDPITLLGQYVPSAGVYVDPITGLQQQQQLQQYSMQQALQLQNALAAYPIFASATAFNVTAIGGFGGPAFTEYNIGWPEVKKKGFSSYEEEKKDG